MAYEKKRLDDLLKSSGAELIRQRKHLVYRLPDGRKFVQPRSGSDWRGERNALADLRRILSSPAQNPSKAQIRTDSHATPADSFFARENWAPRSRSPVVIPPLGQLSSQRQERQQQYSSLTHLLGVLGGMPSFWELCAKGRIKAIQKLSGSIATPEVVSVSYCRSSVGDVRDFLHRRSENESIAFLRNMELQPGDEWMPALVFPLEGEMVAVEATVAGKLTRFEQIAIAPFLVNKNRPVRAAHCIITSDDYSSSEDENDLEVIFYITGGNRAWCSFHECDQWTDPSTIRPVIKEALEKVNTDPELPMEGSVLDFDDDEFEDDDLDGGDVLD